MKYLSGLIFAVLFASSAFSQQSNLIMKPTKVHFSSPVNAINQTGSNTQTVNGFLIDYDSADARIYGASKYKRYVWPMNNHYTPADSSMNYCIVAFDSLFDTYNNVGYDHDSVSDLGVDSIFLMLGQENNSGIDDTLRVRIIAVDTIHGYPDQNINYFWSDIIIPFNAPLSGNWRSPVRLRLNPFTSVYHNKFAIMVEYYGNRSDTLGIVAGFGYRDTCTATSTLNADTTHFSKVRKQSSGDSLIANSFAVWSQFQNFGLLPTKNGSNIFYDCNGNSQYDGGTDGESYIQNIQFSAHIKTNAAGVNELTAANLAVLQNIPNPFSSNTIINYELKENSAISFDVFDVAGKKIISRNEGALSRGKHSIEVNADKLEAGFYFYSLSSGKTTITKKMIVTK